MNRQFVFQNEPFGFRAETENEFEMNEWQSETQSNAAYCRTGARNFAPVNPAELITIRGYDGRKIQMQAQAGAMLTSMIVAARGAGIPAPLLLPVSGYRSLEKQKKLWAQALAKQGGDEKKARKWVCKPSPACPHLSGLAVDLWMGSGVSGKNASIQRDSNAYKWLVENAKLFGFTGYCPEPWHWEYNPPTVASELHETGSTSAPKASFRYVKDFSGPAAECAAALKQAGKTKAEALKIINNQIGTAIKMLRKAAADLKRGSRSTATKTIFQKIFRVKPEFVPTWLKPTATIKDRGDVVATRCRRVADMLASGKIKFFCTINSTNCPDCGNDASGYACSSWGDESKAPKNSLVICLGNAFWADMKAGRIKSMLSTLMHEPFHIYFGKYVTSHRDDAGKFGGINCIVQFVFETNARTAPSRVNERCQNMAVRKEINSFLSI